MYIVIGLLLFFYLEKTFSHNFQNSTVLIKSHQRLIKLKRSQKFDSPLRSQIHPLKLPEMKRRHPETEYLEIPKELVPTKLCTPTNPSSDCSYVEDQFPLPECYTNDAGYLCCNKDMEILMYNVYSQIMTDSKFHRCNIQFIANEMNKHLQTHFNSSFETVVGLGDFASKSHFYSNQICKIKVGERYVLAYGTPRYPSLTSPTQRYQLYSIYPMTNLS
ncbi:unnamed protein product [Thelazia callipaeda]|uniref:Ground-like domain-containing protein n=1 Tax=Thelazia callipaeda TaxID=103827 RepID=A0A0N5CVE4_THECL|nr:unnamed protein product [Thelazia callipaeda]